MPQKLNLCEAGSSDVFTFKNKINNKTLLQSLFDQKSIGQFCDVQIVKNDEVWRLHACVLFAFSPYIAEILKKCSIIKDNLCTPVLHWCKTSPLIIDIMMIIDDMVNICSMCVTKVIDFMYLGNILIDSTHINHLEVLSKKLKINELMVLCSVYRSNMKNYKCTYDVNKYNSVKNVDDTLIDKIVKLSNFTRIESFTDTVLKEGKIDISCKMKITEPDKNYINNSSECENIQLLQENKKQDNGKVEIGATEKSIFKSSVNMENTAKCKQRQTFSMNSSIETIDNCTAKRMSAESVNDLLDLKKCKIVSNKSPRLQKSEKLLNSKILQKITMKVNLSKNIIYEKNKQSIHVLEHFNSNKIKDVKNSDRLHNIVTEYNNMVCQNSDSENYKLVEPLSNQSISQALDRCTIKQSVISGDHTYHKQEVVDSNEIQTKSKSEKEKQEEKGTKNDTSVEQGKLAIPKDCFMSSDNNFPNENKVIGKNLENFDIRNTCGYQFSTSISEQIQTTDASKKIVNDSQNFNSAVIQEKSEITEVICVEERKSGRLEIQRSNATGKEMDVSIDQMQSDVFEDQIDLISLSHEDKTSQTYGTKLKSGLSKDQMKPEKSKCRKFTKSKRQVYFCSFCSFVTARIHNFVSHLVCTDHEYTKCLICNYKLEDKTLLKAHLQNHVGPNPFFCYVCDKRFSTKQLFEQHRSFHFPGRFSCNYCSRIFKKLGYLKTHIFFKHNHNSYNKKIFECPDAGCPFKTDRKFDLKRHLITHSKSKAFQCDFCKTCFSQQKNLLRHIKVKHSSNKFFKCIFCTFITISSDKLQKHYSQTHELPNPTESELSVLKSSNKNQTYRFLHTMKKRNEIQPNTSNTQPDLQISHGKSCEICKKKFKQENNLRTHILTVHTQTFYSKKTTYECVHSDCKFITDSEFDLYMHAITHSNGNVFRCDICNIFYSEEKKLKNHMKVHFFKCICRLIIPTDKIQVHLRKKHKIDNLSEMELSMLTSNNKNKIHDFFQAITKNREILADNSNILVCAQSNDTAKDNVMSQIYLTPSVCPVFVPNAMDATEEMSSVQQTEVSNDTCNGHTCTIDCIISTNRNDNKESSNEEQNKTKPNESENKHQNLMTSFVIKDTVINAHNENNTSIDIQQTSDTLGENMYILNEATGELLEIGLNSFSELHKNMKLGNNISSTEDNLDFSNLISVHNNTMLHCENSRQNENVFVAEGEHDKNNVNMEQFNNSRITEDVINDGVQNESAAKMNELELTHKNESNNTDQMNDNCLLNEIVEDTFDSYKNTSGYEDDSKVNYNASDPVMNWHEFNDIQPLSFKPKEDNNYIHLNNRELSHEEYILNEQTGNIIFPTPFLNEGTGELSVINMAIDPIQFINMLNVEDNDIGNVDTYSIASDDNTFDDINIEQNSVPNIFNIPFEPTEPEDNCNEGGNFLNELTGELCEQYKNLCTQSIVDELIDKSNINKYSVLDEATGELLENIEFDEDLFKDSDTMVLNESTGEISTQDNANNQNGTGYSWNNWFLCQDDSLDSFSLENKVFPDDISIDELLFDENNADSWNALDNESAEILLNESTGELIKNIPLS